MASRNSWGNQLQDQGTITRTNSSASQQGQQTSNSSGTTKVDKSYLSAVGRQALDNLIAQLAAGGTTEQRAVQEDILRTIQKIEVERTKYTKDAAFRDAEGAVQLQLQRSLEETLPAILLAGQAAGTSGDAISALLTNDLTARAAGESALLGTQTAASYGQISAALLSDQVELLEQRNDPATEALLQALQVDKGSREKGTTRTRNKSSESSSRSSSGSSVSVVTPRSSARTTSSSSTARGQNISV